MADAPFFDDDAPAATAVAAPARRIWSQVLPAANFYAAWSGLAFLSHVAGRTTLAPSAAALLLGAVVITSLLLALLYLPADEGRADAATATGQAGLAITWTTVYALLAEGPGELVPGMYLTAILVAYTQAHARQLRLLAFAASGGYMLCLLIQFMAVSDLARLWGDLLQCCGVIGMLAVLVHRATRTEGEQRRRASEVDRLRQDMERLTRSSERDHLTKSFNRQYILDALTREKARADRTGRSFSICIFDLDRFKALNDEHGHVVGDKVLTEFADRAKRALRSMDAINPTRFRRALGRLGGEEFLAVLPSTEVDGALRCAERVRDAVARDPVEHDLQITVSAGVAEYRSGESIPELLTRADQALYAAKRSGRNRVRVSPQPAPADNAASGRPTLRVVR